MIPGRDEQTNYELPTYAEGYGGQANDESLSTNSVLSVSKYDIRYSKFGREAWKLFRFLIVGGGTVVFQSGLYLLFSRLLMPDLSRTASYALAVGYAVLVNYIGHRAWTFQDQAAAQGSARRYITVVILGSILNAGIFWVGHAVLHVYDLIVVFVASAIIPFFTYFAHRVYTFHPQPRLSLRPYIRSTADSV